MAGLRDSVKGATGKVSVKKASSVPTIPDVPEYVEKAAEKVVELKVEIKEKEGELESQGKVVTDFCGNKQDGMGFKGMFNKSYYVPAGKFGQLLYSTQNRFKISTEAEADIKKLLGKAYDDLICKKITVTLKEGVLDNEELTNELEALLGDKFDKFFEVTPKLFAKEGFDKDIYRVVKTPEKLGEVRAVVEPYKPSLK
jgi:hypothetical protein